MEAPTEQEALGPGQAGPSSARSAPSDSSTSLQNIVDISKAAFVQKQLKSGVYVGTIYKALDKEGLGAYVLTVIYAIRTDQLEQLAPPGTELSDMNTWIATLTSNELRKIAKLHGVVLRWFHRVEGVLPRRQANETLLFVDRGLGAFFYDLPASIDATMRYNELLKSLITWSFYLSLTSTVAQKWFDTGIAAACFGAIDLFVVPVAWTIFWYHYTE
ncbi:hypothetical protein DFJ74DRAFT_714304 [Hyaloraphidium curvatum]|nr:hypothetical protein DFJ74DRAFT_714304 [Hyaloraphidium curvatum]